ncbi:MAG: InlB B-repeat-containing protein [Clostridia bacterium]|nr:InlB B-repeat-containing protein [Clostridia bacterium]
MMKNKIFIIIAAALAVAVAAFVIVGCVSRNSGRNGTSSGSYSENDINSGTDSDNSDSYTESDTSTSDSGTESVVDPTEELFTVTFDSRGGTEVISQSVEKGGKAVEPTGIQKQGNKSVTYSFKGWYNGDVLYDFDSEVTCDLTLVAVWEEQRYGEGLEF